MKKYFNLYNCINLVFIIATLAMGGVYCFAQRELLFKTIASASFVLIGLISLFAAIKNKLGNIKFAMIMTIGLFFAMLGDILLELNFMIGAIFFAIGHVFYFVAYCTLVKFKWTDLIAGGVIALVAILVICLLPIFDFGGIVMQIMIIFYAIIISLMLGKALSNLIRERSVINIIILVGSFLFFFSDLMLLLGNFASFAADIDRILGYLCLCTYYPAEVLLALSLNFLPKTEMKAEEKAE